MTTPSSLWNRAEPPWTVARRAPRLRRAMLASVLALSLGASGCYGSFALARTLHTWNGEATGERFVNALIFFGLVIVPVYELALLGDALIFNTVEFWSGSNPVAQVETSEPEVLADGAVEVQSGGRTYRLSMLEGAEAALLSVDGVEAAIVRRGEDGSVSVTDLARAHSYELPPEVVARLLN